jgi:multisubunit Na+/H+ antiporter MnhB subunit
MNDEIDLIAKDRPIAAPVAPLREPYDPTRDRERIRGVVALLMIGLLIATIAGILVSLATGWLGADGIEKVSTALISPIVGLVGTVLGFYFGSQTRRDPG